MDVTPPLNPVAEPDGAPDDWETAFRAKLAEVERAAREWGLRWDQPEGRFVSVLLGAIAMLGDLIRKGQAATAASDRERRAAEEIELAKLSTALQLADRTVERGDQAVRQARNAQIAAVVQQEAVTQRMIDETLPMFAQALKEALVIREARWNRRQAWRHRALIAAVVLGIFGAGCGLGVWSDGDSSAVIDQCLTHPIVSGGNVYCWLGPDAAATRQSR